MTGDDHHPLSKEQLTDIFQEDIKPGYGTIHQSGNPTLYMVGGQPGAGKTIAIASVRRAHPGATAIIGDELRRFHPDYRHLMVSDTMAMPEITSPASNAWVEMSLDTLRKAKADTPSWKPPSPMRKRTQRHCNNSVPTDMRRTSSS